MYIYIYIYIYLSLSLSMYMYICMYTYIIRVRMHSASASVLLQTTVLLQLFYLEYTSAVPLLFPSCPASDLALLLSPFWSETEIFLRHLHLPVIAHALDYSIFCRSSKLDGGPYFFLPDGILKFRQVHICILHHRRSYARFLVP